MVIGTKYNQSGFEVISPAVESCHGRKMSKSLTREVGEKMWATGVPITDPRHHIAEAPYPEYNTDEVDVAVRTQSSFQESYLKKTRD